MWKPRQVKRIQKVKWVNTNDEPDTVNLDKTKWIEMTSNCDLVQFGHDPRGALFRMLPGHEVVPCTIMVVVGIVVGRPGDVTSRTAFTTAMCCKTVFQTV